MATRFYFDTGHAADISLTRPLPSGFAWEQNVPSLPTTRKINKTAKGTANNAAAPYGQLNSNLGTGANNCDILFFQGISDPLAAQTISGNVTGQVCIREGNTSDNLYTQLAIYVVNSAGTLVATLLGGSTSGGTEANNPSANARNMPRGGSTALTSYTCAAGDRIVVEVGVRTESTRTTVGAYMYIGDPSTTPTDLPFGETSNNLTINPWIEISNTLTFGNGATFTANSILKKVQTPTFTADAVIWDGQRNFTIDAVVFGAAQSSFTADAIKKVTSLSGSFTLDAWKSQVVSGTFSADSIHRVLQGVIVEDDPNRDVSGGWGTASDGNVWENVSDSVAGTNSAVAADGSLYVTDTNGGILATLQGGKIKGKDRANADLSALIRLKDLANQPNAGQTEAGIAVHYDGNLGPFANYVGAFLVLGSNSDKNLYAHVRTTRSSATSLIDTGIDWAVGDKWYVRVKIKNGRFKFKVWAFGDPQPSAWLYNDTGYSGSGRTALFALTDFRFAQEGIKWGFRYVHFYDVDTSFDPEAVIRKPDIPGSFTADAIKRVLRAGSFTLDSTLLGGLVGSFSADAVKRSTQAGTLTANAVKKATTSGSFTLDASILIPGFVGSFTADGIVKRSSSAQFSTASVLRSTASGSFSTASVLLRSAASSFSLDAWLIKVVSGSFTSHSVLLRRTLVSFIGDAVLLREQNRTATVNAIVRRGATGSFGISAVLLSPRTATFPASAVVKATSSAAATVNAVLKGTVSGSFTASAISLVTQASSFTAGANLKPGDVHIPFDAILLKTQLASFAMDAVCGLAALPDIEAETVIEMLEADTVIEMIEGDNTIDMIEADLTVEYLAAETVIDALEVSYE